jgi:hypothetical protein
MDGWIRSLRTSWFAVLFLAVFRGRGSANGPGGEDMGIQGRLVDRLTKASEKMRRA